MEEEGIIEPCGHGISLEDDQNYRYYDNRFVQSVFWSITGRCNYRCRHCYMDAPEGALGELSHEQAIAFIDEMAECGVLCVDITGGEPFVRKDFWLLVDRIQSHKMTVRQIYTNGWLLNDSILDEFEKRNLKPEISISFDGVGWHDWMRGVKGAEEAALRALKLCKRRGFPMNVELCVHKGNQETLRETMRILSDIGVPALKVANVSPTDLWSCNSEGNDLDTRAYTEAMIRYIPHFFEDGMPMDVMLTGVVSLHKGSKNYEVIPVRLSGTEECLNRLLCGAVRYACYITPEGRLLPCMPMTACEEQAEFPLIQDIGLKKGLGNSFYMNIVDSRVKDLLAKNTKCAACEFKYRCGGGCRAFALAQTGDLMGCDGNQCLLWKEGYTERIRETADTAIARYCTNQERSS
ncbi:radical SAM/SPASM domain-containing protein [Acetatifactor aquisgranensis]|uniref:radical SAM/SPASM domain-containing protein n=1 Tax=Acetatifactor aquisgranensis TaxID=2941233 RepID=UPI002041A25C|nr:radical SAM protein [Acetatifactor aquisgranensis]